MNKELLKEYAETKNQIKELTSKAKEMEVEVLAEVVSTTKELEMDNLKTDYGTFSLTERKSYTYSEDYTKRESEIALEIVPIQEEMKPFEEKISGLRSELDEVAKSEEESGKAKVEIKTGLRFSGGK